ncbi:MAG: hypothetical protein AAF318_03820 [Pseudomonadota bacterium]
MKHIVLAVAGAALLTASPAAAQEFYEGKTINCIVPYAPGGGTDSFFRVVVPHLARLTPGQPDIVITNMDGAGGMKANNYVSQDAPNDGSEMLCAPWLSIAQLTKRAGVRFDYSKMIVIGGESAIDTAIISKDVLPDGDVKNIADAERVVIAGLSPSSTLDLRQRLALDMLGVNYLYVPGYRGQAKQLPAFLSGEVSLVGSNYGTYAATAKEAFIDNGPGTLFVHYPSFDADGNAIPASVMEELGVMRLDELYEHVHGAAPEGELWEAFKTLQTLSNMGLSAWLPEGSPDAAVEALRTAWQALPNDPEFQEAHRQAFGKEVNFLSTDDALLAQASVGEASAEMTAFFQDYIAKGEQ